MEPESGQSSTGSAKAPGRSLDRVGRDGALSLVFEARNGRTILTKRHFKLPLQVLEPVPLDPDGSALVVLLNPTGGLLGGDRLTSEIVLGPKTHVCLTTASATKVYRTEGPASLVETRIELGEGAILEYLPDHVIPHPGAVLHQSLELKLANGSCALVLDALAAGRVARGELWQFKELKNRIAVAAQGKPLFLDRACLEPGRQGTFGERATEGFHYLATLGFFGGGSHEWESLAGMMQQDLNSMAPIFGGASPLSQGGVIARLLAAAAPEMTTAIAVLMATARCNVLNLPPIRLRKY